jgi:hypothetical protein
MHAIHALCELRPIASIPKGLDCILLPLAVDAGWVNSLQGLLLLHLVSVQASERHILYIFFANICRLAGRPSWLFHSALTIKGYTAWGWCRVLHLHPAIAFWTRQ